MQFQNTSSRTKFMICKSIICNRRTVADYNVSIGVKIRQSASKYVNQRQNTSIGVKIRQSASKYVNPRLADAGWGGGREKIITMT